MSVKNGYQLPVKLGKRIKVNSVHRWNRIQSASWNHCIWNKIRHRHSNGGFNLKQKKRRHKLGQQVGTCNWKRPVVSMEGFIRSDCVDRHRDEDALFVCRRRRRGRLPWWSINSSPCLPVTARFVFVFLCFFWKPVIPLPPPRVMPFHAPFKQPR